MFNLKIRVQSWREGVLRHCAGADPGQGRNTTQDQQCRFSTVLESSLLHRMREGSCLATHAELIQYPRPKEAMPEVFVNILACWGYDSSSFFPQWPGAPSSKHFSVRTLTCIVEAFRSQSVHKLLNTAEPESTRIASFCSPAHCSHVAVRSKVFKVMAFMPWA